MTDFVPFISSTALNESNLNANWQANKNRIDAVRDGSLAMSAPEITSFVNSEHDHSDAANGGQIALAGIEQGGASNGEILTWNSTAWEPSAAPVQPLTTKGDIVVHDGDDPVRLDVGADKSFLVADSVQDEGIAWKILTPELILPRATALGNTANQSISAATWTALTFDTEHVDLGGLHSGANPTRITIPLDGLYLLLFSGAIATGASATDYAHFYLNGATVITQDQFADAGRAIKLFYAGTFTAADYVEVRVNLNSGGTMNGTYLRFSCHMIGRSS